MQDVQALRAPPSHKVGPSVDLANNDRPEGDALIQVGDPVKDNGTSGTDIVGQPQLAKSVRDMNPHVPPVDSLINFNEIRQKCERNDVFEPDMFSPYRFAHHRQAYWPDVNRNGMGDELSSIYDRVKATGLPNALQARQLLPTNLNLDMWMKELSLPGEDHQLLQFIRYGFPLGYAGPTSNSSGVDNHRSANDFPQQVSKFIDTEISLGG